MSNLTILEPPSPRFRMSFAPVWGHCPASLTEPGETVDHSWMQAGRAWHKVRELLIEEKPIDRAALAAEYNVATEDIEEAEEACRASLAKLGDFQADTRNVEIEVMYPIYKNNATWTWLVGHIDDVAWLAQDHPLIIDAKTGWGEVADPAKNLQLLCYLVAVDHASDGKCEKISVLVEYPRQKRASERYDFGPAEISGAHDLISALAARALYGPREYRPGPHCQYCPAHTTCPAIGREIANLGAKAPAASAIAALPVSELGPLMVKVKLLEGWLKGVKDAFKDRLMETGEIVPDGNGKAWAVRPLALKTVALDAMGSDGKTTLAWMMERFGSSALSALNVSNGELEKVAAAGAEKKAPAIRQLWDELRDRGALIESQTTTLRMIAEKENSK